MAGSSRNAAKGFSLIELLVVASIIVILAALAIPGFARLGLFSRDELKSASNEVYSLLKAAQVYAATYHVTAAVAYSLNNWDLDPDTGQPRAPEGDSVTGESVRYIDGAALMFKHPQYGVYIPVPGSRFREFPGRMTILLRDPSNGMLPVYYNFGAGYVPAGNQMANLGMSDIEGIPFGLDDEFQGLATSGARATWINTHKEAFPAHVFKPSGSMLMDAGGKERYTILVGPRPDEDAEARQIDPALNSVVQANGSSNLMAVPVQVYKSTGRVRIAS